LAASAARADGAALLSLSGCQSFDLNDFITPPAFFFFALDRPTFVFSITSTTAAAAACLLA